MGSSVVLLSVQVTLQVIQSNMKCTHVGTDGGVHGHGWSDDLQDIEQFAHGHFVAFALS
jgi:hypothetical protein